MLSPGRPYKMEPKLIMGLISLPFSGEELISDYLILKYNFTVVSLNEILGKHLLDNNIEGLSVFSLLQDKGVDFLIKKAILKVRRLGRPLALIRDFRCGEEIDFCKKDESFFSVSLLAEEKTRWQRYLASALKEEKFFSGFQREMNGMLNYHCGNGVNFRDYLYRSNFRIQANGSLSRIYEEIERVLEKIAEKNEDLKKIITERNRFSKK